MAFGRRQGLIFSFFDRKGDAKDGGYTCRPCMNPEKQTLGQANKKCKNQNMRGGEPDGSNIFLFVCIYKPRGPVPQGKLKAPQKVFHHINVKWVLSTGQWS